MAYVEVDEPIVLDSTGQDIKDELTAIKSAVQGLGTALGSDRALIDGSNIASPSTFRQNIGLITDNTTLTSPISQVYRQNIDKINGVVYLYIDINNLNTTTETTIGTIPSGFRPTHNINYEAIVIGSADASFKGYAHINIKTTGAITYKSMGSYSSTFTTINTAYPI